VNSGTCFAIVTLTWCHTRTTTTSHRRQRLRWPIQPALRVSARPQWWHMNTYASNDASVPRANTCGTRRPGSLENRPWPL